jgi:hypothetical protein
MTPADQLLRDLRDYVSTIRKGLATSWDADNAMLKRIDAHLATNAATPEGVAAYQNEGFKVIELVERTHATSLAAKVKVLSEELSKEKS